MTFPRLAVPALPALLALVLAVGGCVTAKKAPEAEEILTYSDWGAFNNVLSSGNVMFGGRTDTRRQDGTVTSLLVVMFPSNCVPYMLSVTYDLPAPKAEASKSLPATGEIRVDDMAPIPIQYICETYGGKTKVFIDFESAMTDATLTGQMAKGSVIRLKANVFGKDMTFRFSLKNYTEAMNRVTYQCKEEQAFRSSGGSATPAKPSGQAPAPPQGGWGGSLMGPSGRPSGNDSQFFK